MLEKTALNETDVAMMVKDNFLPSPTRFMNFWLFRVRITGTGKAMRKGDGDKIKDEYVYRDPANYLTAEFLERCKGLLVIWQHPEGKILNSTEFQQRVIGMIVCPFIRGSEVWGVAKVFDDDAAAILSHIEMSTSPSVVFGTSNVNREIAMDDGSVLLIEGDPNLLDHLAICEVGVWDKQRDPYGVISETAS